MLVPKDNVETKLTVSASQASYEIYPLTEKNLKEALYLDLLCFSQAENYTKSIFKHLLAEPNTLSYGLVTAQNQMSGFIFIVASDTIGHIIKIGVAPEHRKRGLAKKLLMYAEDSLRKKNFDSIILEVSVSNYIAQNLYHQFDYKIIQKLKGYYSNNESAYLMAKLLQ